jgi:hypothetical protein
MKSGSLINFFIIKMEELGPRVVYKDKQLTNLLQKSLFQRKSITIFECSIIRFENKVILLLILQLKLLKFTFFKLVK